MRFLSCFILSLLSLSLTAQFKGSSYQFPERFSKNYFFDPAYSYSLLKNYTVDGISKEDMEYYKMKNTYGLQQSFDNNLFYLEWYDLEKYLEKLVDTIMPAKIKQDLHFKVFIKRDPNFKIEVLGNGFIFINIGTFAICKNEAELAYLLAHKIYHTVYATNADLKKKYDKTKSVKNYALNEADEKLKIITEDYFDYEMHADSFAYKQLLNTNLNINNLFSIANLLQYSESMSLRYSNGNFSLNIKAIVYHKSNTDSISKNRKKADKAPTQQKQRMREYAVDSIYFCKLKKTTTEECKKICSEDGNYTAVLKISFNEYLLGNNSIKNIYTIFESIRKILYAKPELKDKGFLAEELQFTKDFENSNYSILKKPEYLFIDSLELVKASKHPLIKDDVKPFNTYEDAFLYFAELAENQKLNEAYFSKALFYFAKKDEANFRHYLAFYTENGGGLYTDLANNLDKNGFPYLKDGKTNVVIDFGSTWKDNYFQSLSRIKYNDEAYKTFKYDTSKVKLTLYNELIGIHPKTLNEYQKLKDHLNSLYSSTEFEKFRKKNYLGKESMDDRELKNKYNKNLFIYVPDWYKWFTENKYNGVMIQNLNYEYQTLLDTVEIENNYSIKYINFYENRPYFYNTKRTKNSTKQNTPEMLQDARDYLLFKE